MPKNPNDPTQNPEHLGNIPAGFKRNEENLKRTDRLAEEADKASADAGSFDPSALKKEREILDNFDPYTGECEVSNKQPGRHYVWVLANTTVIASYNRMHFQAVSGDDPEAKEHKGQHRAAGTSMRGVGDTLLYWCTIENHEALEAHYQKKTNAVMGVEENWEMEANFSPTSTTRPFGPLAHGNPNDPTLRRTVLRGTRGQIQSLMDMFRTGRFGRAET